MGSRSPDAFRYDLVSYPTGAFDDTHPRRLATLAALYVVDAPAAPGGAIGPDFAGARILELGCGSGGNLIPMAYSLPGATLLGVDLASREVEAAQKSAAHLGLRNVTFRCLDILDVTQELGTFDYIVAHGVYSWVPSAVQDRLLWVCGSLLSAKGVAYVSYNTLPGGRVRQLVDDMMKYHVRNESDPMARVHKARAFTHSLVDSLSPQDALYRSLLSTQRDRLAKIDAEVLFHDDLAEPNEAVFLHDFVARAARHGLRYLADAEFESMHAHRFPGAAPLLAQLTDRVELEQYLDFLSCRTFRRTLLCRAEVELAAEPIPERVQQMWAVSYAQIDGPASELFGPAPLRFRNRAGVVVGLGDPLAKVALSCLIAAAPQALHFAELLTAVTERMNAAGVPIPEPAALGATLCELLVMLYSGDMVELYAQIPTTAPVPGDKPLASALARAQARESSRVINLWHRNLIIDDALALRLLPLLDGTRDRAELLTILQRATESAAPEGTPDAAAVATTLRQLARLGLLLP